MRWWNDLWLNESFAKFSEMMALLSMEQYEDSFSEAKANKARLLHDAIV